MLFPDLQNISRLSVPFSVQFMYSNYLTYGFGVIQSSVNSFQRWCDDDRSCSKIFWGHHSDWVSWLNKVRCVWQSPLWGAVYSCVQYSTAHTNTADDFCQSCLCADCSTSIKPCFCETFVNQSCQSNEASLCYISVHCRMHDGSMHQKGNMPALKM